MHASTKPNSGLILSLILFISFTISSCENTAREKSQSGEENNEWIILFDGSNADAWRGFNRESLPGGWKVENGLLITSGQGGDLGGDIITKQQFEDFRLHVEWNVSPGGNSGIFFAVVEGDFPAVYATGPEYQLIDDIGFEYLWGLGGPQYISVLGIFHETVGDFFDGVLDWYPDHTHAMFMRG